MATRPGSSTWAHNWGLLYYPNAVAALPRQGQKNELTPTFLWKDSAPILHDGKVVFTAADNEKVHCLNQHDGRLLWESRPPDGLYLAGVVGDNVVVVCNSCCRALSLKDGKEVWKVDIGTPSGMGVFDKTTYLVPVKVGAASKAPEIVYLDAERGQIVGTSPLKEVPGNLALYRDQIVSVAVKPCVARCNAVAPMARPLGSNRWRRAWVWPHRAAARAAQEGSVKRGSQLIKKTSCVLFCFFVFPVC
jgi:hypothetical protein